EESVLLQYILKEIAFEKDLSNKKILVTAGATREPIDPVRFITNHSSGKMGCAIAKAAMLRGAEVTLVYGHMEVTPPPFIKAIPVTTAEDMYIAVTEHSAEQDIIIKAAAVADYTPTTTATGKIKKSDSDMKIDLKRTKDILASLGQNKKPNQIICGFSMETDNVLENSRKKLFSKNCDMICANSLSTEGSGFKSDTNIITLITKESTDSLEKMTKEQAAHIILDKLSGLSDSN
ncbi:MAG: bifunctional phosphopantothenoylcysteine decarboxylase/phosphopantothenate--cysteine ligase CoaBC, partial [Ruminococcus sp.]|nr:bifunctional phosphopantothenoylcysteine decarboxylase/phosphopantothenate--cysteine ligase CoaBC [Ruminococcus sp.]